MKHQTGQIGLVVLLIAAVLLTVGVGVASESVQVQKTTRQETESSETFSAAEDAVEWALGQDLSSLGTYTGSWTQGDVTVNSQPSTTYSRTLDQGESAQVSLVGTNGNFTVTWNSSGDCNTTSASIIITTLDSSGLVRNAYTRSQCAGARGDGFSVSGVTDSGDFSSVEVPSGGYPIARIKAVYANTEIQVSGLAGNQQYTVTATAAKNSGETRAVQVTKDLPAVPWIFDYALFSGNGDIAVTSP